MEEKALTYAMMFAKAYHKNEQEMEIELIATSVIQIPNH